VAPAFRPAQVLRVGAAGAESTFLLDIGSNDGVTVGSPVLAPGGLVGMVWAVDRTQSQAIDWTRPEFRASAVTADGETYGIVEPKRGRFREEDVLVLRGTPFHSDVRVGTRVVTSGRGALFPRGVPIGTVAGIDDADTGWRKSYLVRPAARPEGLLHVLVGIGGSGEDLTRLFTQEEPADTALPRLLPPADTASTGRDPAGAESAP
jgi:rod shape-determining protein MreC